MAEGVVSFAVQNLTDLLTQEVSLIRSVHGQVQQLRDELKFIRSFLRDADNKQETEERVREWVSLIRDIAYDAEDIIDNYILHIGKKKGVQRRMMRRGLLAAVKNYMICLCIKVVELHKIGKDIDAIQKRLSDISSKKERYGIRNLGEVGEGSSSLSERLRMSRRSSPYGDEEDITGLNDTIKELVAQLTGDELRRCVISIVGMGGLGKTSLAKKIYNHSSIKSRFQNRAWVYVSQEYSIADLLRRIIKSFTNPSKEEWEMMETEEDLERWLYNFLKRKRYLVVLDDVWDLKAWQSLKRAFPNKNNGSGVLLTTRKLEVPLSVDDPQRNPPHQLRFLTKEESWELFCKKVFPNICGDLTFCSPDLEELGRKMVGKCDGLPLGIIVLGGLLSKKRPNEWKRVLDHISTKLMQDETGQISQILSLSYNDLPYQLKSCFLYMGLFPEDSSIDTERLVQLWVAEGFIPQGEEVMEDVAKDYLRELIDRSMIQAERKNWRGIVTCRIHDLLRDLSISKAKEESFLDIFEKVDDSSLRETSRRRLRRLTIHFDLDRFVSLNNNFPIPYLRSIIYFNIGGGTIQLEQFRFISTNFKLLKILDLDAGASTHAKTSSSSSLCYSIGEIIHLRYLGLKGMRINALPTSIENLQRLQTLKMADIEAVKLPNVLWKLKQLRHLQGNWVGEGIRHLKIDTLINLQTLDCIRDDAFIENEDLANLTNLRTLSIRVVSPSSNVDTLSAPLSRLSSLQHLTLADNSGLEAPIVLKSLECYNLLYLRLEGIFEGLPNNLHQFSPNLTEVSLQKCYLKEDPMAMLEKLPNLLELTLFSGAYVGKEIICSRKGFPRLQVLSMLFLDNLLEWRVEEGAMPRLQTLTIVECRKLEKVPEGFKFITSLRKLEFEGMPIDFKNRVLQGGEDNYKVQHIPSVTFRGY